MLSAHEIRPATTAGLLSGLLHARRAPRSRDGRRQLDRQNVLFERLRHEHRQLLMRGREARERAGARLCGERCSDEQRAPAGFVRTSSCNQTTLEAAHLLPQENLTREERRLATETRKTAVTDAATEK